MGTDGSHDEGSATEDAAGEADRTGDAYATGDAHGSDDQEADVAALREEIADLRAELDEKTMPRDELERDLRRYVRGRVRRGHARGWGPYLVLLYGTAMTLGSFYFLDGGWAVLAMLVIWLSTLGLYALMVIIGLGATLLGIPGRLRDALGRLRSR